jgi:hypothetical protein
MRLAAEKTSGGYEYEERVESPGIARVGALL